MKLFFRAVESILTYVYHVSLTLLVALMIGTWMNGCSSPPPTQRVRFEDQPPPSVSETSLWKVTRFIADDVTCYVIESRVWPYGASGISCVRSTKP